jgi:hypothetical protein
MIGGSVQDVVPGSGHKWLFLTSIVLSVCGAVEVGGFMIGGSVQDVVGGSGHKWLFRTSIALSVCGAVEL